MRHLEKTASLLVVLSLATFIISTAICLVIDNSFIEKMRDINFFVFGGVSLLIVIVKSDIWMNKSFRKFLFLQLTLFCILILLQIVHLQNALAILLCFLTLMILYFMRFLKKEKKQFLDFLKLLWVITGTVMLVFSLLHYPYKTLIEISYQIAFWLLIIFYWIDWLKLKTSKL